jgi:predicted HTH transcriptional regulator
VVVPSSAPESAAPEVQIVERVVEKVVERVVEKEVVKEVPVEKIVEKVVYRDPEPMVCPPPTEEEREAIKRDFLIELSHEGTARKHALVAEKLEKILSLFETRERIMHKDVMDALDCSSTTATRLLTELRHEGKLLLHGQGGNSATYTKIS